MFIPLLDLLWLPKFLVGLIIPLWSLHALDRFVGRPPGWYRNFLIIEKEIFYFYLYNYVFYDADVNRKWKWKVLQNEKTFDTYGFFRHQQYCTRNYLNNCIKKWCKKILYHLIVKRISKLTKNVLWCEQRTKTKYWLVLVW